MEALFKNPELWINNFSKEEIQALTELLQERLDYLNNCSKELLPEEISLVAQGKPIFAIKSIRLRLDIGLREAKEMVDQYREKMKSPQFSELGKIFFF